MAVTTTLTDLINETAWQQARDAQRLREESSKEGSGRNVGGVMGKNDFLMLLSAQLRHQDPLNPQSDGEFASQLAQFSSLEQMQNMNETLSAMAGYQAYSLVGKYVIAVAVVDGVLSEIPGVVDSVFTRNGTTFAQIGEYVVPISAITDVFDSGSLLSPEMLIQTSNNLLGRTIKAQLGNTIVEGVVTRLTVDRGVLYARIDDGTDNPIFVPVNTIFDIRETGTPGDDPIGPAEPTDQTDSTDPDRGTPPISSEWLKEDGDGYIEFNDEGTEIGRWDWNADDKVWVFSEF